MTFKIDLAKVHSVEDFDQVAAPDVSISDSDARVVGILLGQAKEAYLSGDDERLTVSVEAYNAHVDAIVNGRDDVPAWMEA